MVEFNDPAFDEAARTGKGAPTEGGPDDDLENIVMCEICGQSVDLRELDQVIHHQQPDHKPPPTN